ncbi:MAG TPA: tetratricopeptide repeat protein, partial [Clostridia bacterium]|nr:tetratricopeptide repeat protein [Clostridia bacterium]
MKANDSVSKMPHRARWILLAIAVFGLLTATQSLSAVSLSELLEKGIYTEETKGDLDAAMQLYKQIVSEAQAGQKLAAEAQYRLGVCYYKKKNYAEAVAAFEMLVNN